MLRLFEVASTLPHIFLRFLFHCWLGYFLTVWPKLKWNLMWSKIGAALNMCRTELAVSFISIPIIYRFQFAIYTAVGVTWTMARMFHDDFAHGKMKNCRREEKKVINESSPHFRKKIWNLKIFLWDNLLNYFKMLMTCWKLFRIWLESRAHLL